MHYIDFCGVSAAPRNFLEELAKRALAERAREGNSFV